ncbi:MAG: NTP transferase domain-containing protein [Candidatus Delongbacteria bacterium]|nr:NTP transferase domain-containing protein [Candidatus Delongbacteria bacterium]
MPVIILCGGQGTRIADIAQQIPKPMLPIGDRPILWHIMKIYASHGYKDFYLTLGHLGWEIKNYFLNYKLKMSDFTLNYNPLGPDITILKDKDSIDWTITFVETGETTQTGKRIALCKDYIHSDHFMVTYGDGVGNIDIKQLVEFHLQNGKMSTVTCVRPRSRFGDIETDQTGLVTAFNEKPDAGGGNINGGFFVFKQEFFSILDKFDNVMLEKEPMDDLVEKNQLIAYAHHGFWEPMDTSREFRDLNQLWQEGKAPWKIW